MIEKIFISIVVMLISVFGTLLTTWVLSWRKKAKEEVDIAVQIAKTHELVKDTREDVKDIKEGFNKLEDKVDAQGKRLTVIETEHKMYCKVLHGKISAEDTKGMTLVRILVVDDMPENRELMYNYFHEVLPSKNGWKKYVFQVDTASSYDEAIKKLDAHKDYQLGIFDYKLDPEDIRTGFHICSYCKQRKYLYNGSGKSNFIVYTADKDLLNVPIEFAEHFLNKPVTKEDWQSLENKLKEMV